VFSKSFHSIIEGYSKDRAGSSYIQRGDYEVLREEGNEVLDRRCFRGAITAGNKLEISIVIKSVTSTRCPRCESLNFSIDGSWKIWYVEC